MRVSAQAFWSPKVGNQESEYEDAFWPDHPIISEKNNTFRFAVADGATETSFSAVWAKQLVRAFGRGELDGSEMSQTLNALRERWIKIVSRKPLPWYAEEKIRSGAFAAILGLILSDPSKAGEDGKWHAIAIGDSCLVQLRGKEFVRAFPIQSAAQFGNNPMLLGTKISQEETESQMLTSTEGMWRSGDSIYLMTDAIACWFLTQTETGHVPARELQDLSEGKSKHFHTWLNDMRERKAIRNDDVTLVRIEIEKF